MRDSKLLINQIDWLLVFVYFALVLAGWTNILSVNYQDGDLLEVINMSSRSGRQLLFIGVCCVVILVIMLIDFLVLSSWVVYVGYAVTVLALLVVLFVGRKVGGASSWIDLGGPFKFQPSEFAKLVTSLTLAKYLSDNNLNLARFRSVGRALLVLILPMTLIIMQPDAGTLLVFLGFIIVLYREGLNPAVPVIAIVLGIAVMLTLIYTEYIPYFILAIGLTCMFMVWRGTKKALNIGIKVGAALILVAAMLGVDTVVTNVLKPHQQTRIKVWLDPMNDPKGQGYNIIQSKIAIGSGGLVGKGFLQGTQTNGGFIPEQYTDFIFCTIGEEYGWMGSLVLIVLFTTLILRVFFIAERQRARFGRIYGYSVGSIFFIHFVINVGMATGLVPIIGIPLPFFSYGGSSLVAFTMLLFILIKIDAHRSQVLVR